MTSTTETQFTSGLAVQVFKEAIAPLLPQLSNAQNPSGRTHDQGTSNGKPSPRP